jgi:hypothetical protein
MKRNVSSRREWIRRVAAGTAGLGAGFAIGCSSGKQTEQTVATAPAGNLIQVICHGMMAFKLPPSGGNVIEIHMPFPPARNFVGQFSGNI